MDLRQLEIVKAVAETGSFTAAGEFLHVSQSAVSRQVLLLEDELREAVFVRTGRRTRLTPAGEALVQLSHRVFRDLKDTIDAIGNPALPLEGLVRLAGGMTVSMYVFPTLLRDLRRRHPRLEAKLAAGPSERLVGSIRSGLVDVGLLTLPIEEAGLVTIPVLREELLLIASPRHSLARKAKIQPSDIAHQPFVLFESGSNTRRVQDELFMREGLSPHVVMETENVEIIKAMVQAGLGVSVIPFLAAAREIGGGQLFWSRIQGQPLVRETGWVYPRSSRVPRVVAEVLAAFERVRPRLRLSPLRDRSVMHVSTTKTRRRAETSKA